jgi:hypothetical protein
MVMRSIESEIARLDALYRPLANRPVDIMEPDWVEKMGARVAAGLAALGVEDEAVAVLRALVEHYAAGDDDARAEIRSLFDQHPSFRWAAHLPQEWDSAEDFRAHLLHLSARDQGADTRDEILALQALCARAHDAGIDVDPILDEVAAISSDVDRYGMGSMRTVILNYGKGHPR